jgi:hypothetical protein
MSPPSHRAVDPGLKRHQFGQVTWIECPECDGPARNTAAGAACLRCGYRTIQKREAFSSTWARISADDPLCSFCRGPLPQQAMPTARTVDGKLKVRVRCPACAKSVDYPAMIAFPPQGSSPAKVWRPLYLTAQVGGHTLVVDNLAHLDALEQWLGASLRERGPVRGLTMMARLPAWMKSATMRPKILRALGHLRERARQAGIDE